MMKMLMNLAATMAIVLGATQAIAGNILIVLSDENKLDLKGGKVFETGFYLNELMQPTKAFLDAGHRVSFATPRGRAPAVDRTSIDKMYFGGDQKAMQESQELLDKLKITSPSETPVVSLSRVAQIGYDHFDAVYVPGGHAPMQDLLVDKDVGRLLRHFQVSGKTTALMCHGPIALLSTLPDPTEFTDELAAGRQTDVDAGWIYAGYRMTVFSNGEEEMAKPLLKGGEMKFYPEDALALAGGAVVIGDTPFQPNMIADRELITGQNPASAMEVAAEILKRVQ